MRRNWLAGAVVAAAAISVPVTALSGPVFEGTAQAAATSGQQATATKSAVTSSTVVQVETRRAARCGSAGWSESFQSPWP